jgi:membrane fusion protein (multidrug efflux system)
VADDAKPIAADDAKPIDVAEQRAGARHLGLTPAADDRPFLQRYRWPLMIGGPALVLAVVLFVVLTGGRYQSTDDSYLRADRVAISTSVSGRVIMQPLHENQAVKKGDVLLTLDPRDYLFAEKQAEADLRNASQSASYAEREEIRPMDLRKIGVSSQADLEKAIHQAEQARLEEAASRPRLDVAKKNLADTQVLAPADGVVTKVDQVQVGAVVNAAQPLFFLVSGNPWVEGNFKEDQLQHMRIGQEAIVQIDAFKNVKIKARLASFSPGTGSSFALLPPENATGNWVKVSQRVPVQFELIDPPADVPMIAGLSAKVTVDIKSQPAHTALAAR